MKAAKNQYDQFVAQIQQGETVQFGKMETLFAKALLSRFLEQLRSQNFRERAEQLHRERQRLILEETGDEDSEIEPLSDQELLTYALDQARTAIGALGVRPPVREMQPYLEKAIERKDWPLLNAALSLTEEGKLEKGTLETIVLEALLRRPTREEGDTPSSIRREFGEPHYTRELVEPVYSRALADGNMEGVKAVHEETKITISPALVQTTYETLAGAGRSERMKKLVEVTGVIPEKTSALRTNLINLIVTTDKLEKETLDELDAVIDIRTDAALAKALQLAAVRNGRISTFFDLYNSVGEKERVAVSNVQDAYDTLASTDAIDTIVNQAIQTGIAPRKKVLTQVYSDLLQKQNFARMEELAAKTSTTPRFDDAVVDTTVRSMIAHDGMHTVRLRESLEPFIRFANLVHQAGSAIAEEHVARACQMYLEGYITGEEDRGLEGRIRVVDRIYTQLGIKSSETITALKLERLVKELGTTFGELVSKYAKEYSNGSPLQPMPGSNLGEWRQYSTAARKNVRKHIKDLKAIRRAHPNCSVEQHLQTTEIDARFIQETYIACLETFLTQCSMDEKTVDLPQLIETVGIPINETAVNRALINHIKRNYERQDAGKVLENAQKAGMSVTLNDQQINKIGQEMLTRPEGTLHYLKALIGERTFPPDLQEAVQARSVVELGKGNISDYDKLQSLLSIKRPPTAGEAQTIRKTIIAILTDGKYEALEALHREQAEAMRDRSGIILTATPAELEVMIDKYFEGGSSAKHPSHIARFFNTTLNPDQIRRRYEALLKDRNINGLENITYAYEERIKAVQELMADTGVKYEPKDLQQRVEAEVSKGHSGHFPRWGPLLGLLTTHNVPPEQSTATRIYQASIRDLSKGEYFNTNCLPEIVRRLREFNLPVEDSIAEEVKNLGLKDHEVGNEKLIKSMDWLHHLYQRADILTPAELTTVADAIDEDFTGSHIKAHNRNGTLIRDLSFIYVLGNRQAKANERATLLYTEYKESSGYLNGRFPLYAYCALTGAQPNIETTELAKLKQEVEDVRLQRVTFTTDQREHFVKMIEGWEGAT
ncbi:hypothetical protein J4208_00995 [Candidatus Woesearchaeota archaeon]|nr:hypothetical protein [Candidatus Woesearchaeota archaeon]